jgi:DNA-binding Xre family transcriptional regulator
MLIYNFDRIFKARGIERPFSYLRKAGFSDYLSSKIANNRIKSIRLSSIERFCLLMKCTPNDIMVWIPENNMDYESDHPMNIIKSNDDDVDIIKLINSVPLGKLPEIEKLIEEALEKEKED